MVWPHSFKTCLRFAWRNPENDCHPTLSLSIHLRTMEEVLHKLVIKASWGDQAAVVFASNKLKFMSCCLICLFTAREVFLSQPDSSAITKVHKLNFSLLLYN